MQLGTLDRTPPPFFRQGYSALSKLVFFSTLAVFLMVADTRLALVQPLRVVLATALHPVQRVLLWPLDMGQAGGAYLQSLDHAIGAEAEARRALAAQAERATRADQLAAENARLRALLALKPALQVRSLAAEVLYEAGDPYSRKLFIDHGGAAGVVLAAPVINEQGVVGQVTRVYPLSAEVTLLADKDAAIPVLNTRTGQRSAAFGGAGGDAGEMELRFMAANADVREGDLLTTSGVDGVYPPGLPVARVLHVERRAEGGFARVTLAPAAPADTVRHVLVLEPTGAQLPPRPDAAVPESARARPERRGTGAAP